MRTLKYVLVFLASSFSANCISQTPEEALHYLEEVTSSIEVFRVETWNVLSITIQSRSFEDLEAKISKLVKDIETTKNELVVKGGFYGDLSAKVSMTVFLKTAQRILTNDFREIRNLEKVAQRSFEDMEKYLISQNKTNERLSEAGDRLDEELKKFAERYKVEVTEKKGLISKKIERASLALAYYNQVYLSYFKSYDQRLVVYEALKSEDMELIAREVALLNEFCTESLFRLEILGGFLENDRLNLAALAIVSQFKYEAETVFPLALRAIEKRHLFHLAQGVFEAIPEAERTAKDIDHLNGLIDPLNNAIDKQNHSLASSESMREELFSNWSNEITHFFSLFLN